MRIKTNVLLLTGLLCLLFAAQLHAIGDEDFWGPDYPEEEQQAPSKVTEANKQLAAHALPADSGASEAVPTKVETVAAPELTEPDFSQMEEMAKTIENDYAKSKQVRSRSETARVENLPASSARNGKSAGTEEILKSDESLPPVPSFPKKARAVVAPSPKISESDTTRAPSAPSGVSVSLPEKGVPLKTELPKRSETNQRKPTIAEPVVAAEPIKPKAEEIKTLDLSGMSKQIPTESAKTTASDVDIFGGSKSRAEISSEQQRVSSHGAFYRFREHLSEAKTSITSKRMLQPVDGEWKEGGFVFPRLNPKATIKVEAGNFDGFPQPGIRVFVVKDALRRLHFPWVPPGKKLMIHYGIDDSNILANQYTNAYIRVWVGRHQIARIQVPNEKGWKTEVFDLGLVPILNRTINITFEMTADIGDGRTLYIDGEISGKV